MSVHSGQARRPSVVLTLLPEDRPGRKRVMPDDTASGCGARLPDMSRDTAIQ
jgi:hypothetical protein